MIVLTKGVWGPNWVFGVLIHVTVRVRQCEAEVRVVHVTRYLVVG